MEEQGKAGEILACPWCKSPAELDSTAAYSKFVRCPKDGCDVCGPTGDSDTQAIESWNRVAVLRASHERMREEVAGQIERWESLPSGVDGDADENDESPEDMPAHIAGLAIRSARLALSPPAPGGGVA